MNVQIGQFGAMKKRDSSLTGFASIISSEA
jgi:hypothetical protein